MRSEKKSDLFVNFKRNIKKNIHKVYDTNIKRAGIVSVTFAIVGVVVLLYASAATAITIDPSLPQVTNVRVFPDDRVATVTWDKPAGADNAGIVGYFIEWGETSLGTFPNTKQTTYTTVQLQPLDNTKQYSVRVYAAHGTTIQVQTPGAHDNDTAPESRGSGRVSPFVTATVAPTSARVDQLRTQMTGFFDDFNTPAGAMDELKWNNAASNCGQPGTLGAFVNNQFHAHNQVRSINGYNGEYCDRGQIVSRPRAIFDIAGRTEANPGEVVFDMDGTVTGRDIWYLDLIPVTARTDNSPLDITSHNSAFDDAPTDPMTIRLAQGTIAGGGAKLVYFDRNKNPHELVPTYKCSTGNINAAEFQLCDPNVKVNGLVPNTANEIVSSAGCIYRPSCLVALPNVRRHWRVQLSPTKIKVFVDSVLVLEGNMPADFASITKYTVHSNVFGYNTGKDEPSNPTTTLFHWDNFGFNGPASTTVTHNYIEGGASGTTPYLGRGSTQNPLPTSPRTTIVKIPDTIASPTQARFMFTIGGFSYQYYRWNSNDHIMINGNRYNIPNPSTKIQAPVLNNDFDASTPAYGSSSNPFALSLVVNPVHLISGDNTVNINLNSTANGVANVHIELDYPRGSQPTYTQPKVVFGEAVLNQFIVPPMADHDKYLFVEQNLDLVAPADHGHPTTPSDTVVPTISLTSPNANASVSGSPIVINADASDNVGVARVDFIVDGNVVNTGITSPYSYSWDVTTAQNGNHTVQARAFDAAGLNAITASRSFTVALPIVVVPPPTPPAVTGSWQRIDPSGVNLSDFGANQFGFHDVVGVGSSLYVASSYQGIWKTTDGGVNWVKTNTGRNAAEIDRGRGIISNIHPSQPNTFYYAQIAAPGLFKTTDGGVNFDFILPAAIQSQTTNYFKTVDISPTNPNHIIVGSHQGWAGGLTSGILESTDGGVNWRVIQPASSTWARGSLPRFVTDTVWLMATEGDGFWRTTNSGATWSKIPNIGNMTHGGYRPTMVGSVLYVGTWDGMYRSTDLGASFVRVGPQTFNGGYIAKGNDGSTLWKIQSYPVGPPGVLGSGNVSYLTSPVNDGVNWTVRTDRTFGNGANSYHYDAATRTLYTANWQQGVWKISSGNGTTPPPAPVDTTAPTVSLTSPTTGPSIASSGSFTATASASDTGGSGVSRVEFLIDGTVRHNATGSPYTAIVSAAGLSAGTHTLAVRAFDVAGNQSVVSTSVSFTVQPVVTTNRFETLPVSAVLPSESDCAVRVRRTPEIRESVNTSYNNRRGIGTNSTFPRVTGNFVGTTDEIIQWTACKWGMDEDLLRAQAVQESYWFQNAIGDFDTNGNNCSPVYPVGNYPAQYGGDVSHNGQCPESNGIMQVRWQYHQSAYFATTPYDRTNAANLNNNAIFSTAYNLDYYGQIWRNCYMGNETWLNTVERGEEYRAGDATGCQGVWFSGRWKTAPAMQYITNVQNHLASRTWAQTGFASATSPNAIVSPSTGPTPDTTPPVATVTTPTANQTVTATITVAATATDNSGSVASVSFYLDGAAVPFSTDTSAPFSAVWNSATVSNGSHNIVARARDDAGNIGSSQSQVFTVSNTVPDTTAPSVSVTAPLGTAALNGTVTVSANASDNVGIARVELYVDGNLSATDTTQPYSFAWNTAQVPNGAHTLRLQAYDAAGLSASASVSVSVNNVVTTPPPTTPKPGDVTGDNKINGLDLSILLSNWKRSGATLAQGDLNKDGVVNGLDLSIMLSNWGK